MSKIAHRGVHVSQTSAKMRLFSENLHVVTYRHVALGDQWEIMVETAHNHGLVCQKMRIDTSSF